MALSESLYKMQWTTDISALASQARFGLKYFSKGMNSEETSGLINDGVRLCKILEEGTKAGQKKEIFSSQLGYLKAIKPLMEASVDLKKTEEDVNKVVNILNSILQKKKLDSEDIRFADSFFIGISKIYLKVAFSTLNSLVEEKVFY